MQFRFQPPATHAGAGRSFTGLYVIGGSVRLETAATASFSSNEHRMLTVLDCIFTAHDLRLVGLAAVICALASFTAISLLHHVRRSTGYMRLVWLCVSATSTGFGIWATHFIAMLAFSPGLPSAYNIILTIFSLIAAIFLTGTGLAVAAMANSRAGACLGGA